MNRCTVATVIVLIAACVAAPAAATAAPAPVPAPARTGDLGNAPGAEPPAIASNTLLPAGTGLAAARDPIAKTGKPRTFKVYATREGLVGHTTANGHVVTASDHFVSLPSTRSLSGK